MEAQIISLNHYANVTLKATHYECPYPLKGTILYLHGGGLQFGQRDDLPRPYLQQFVAAGYQVITLDYLLAPESKLDVILPVLQESIATLQTKLTLTTNLYLMGRSAGAYLGYLLLRDGFSARAFLDLYGYASLEHPEFRRPAEFYTAFPAVPPMQAQALVQAHPLTTGDLKDRYPLYVSSRQFGTWLSQILPSIREAAQYSLTATDLAQLPPTLSFHSRHDPDIPFTAAELATQANPAARLISVAGHDHDFDRTVTPMTQAHYQTMIDFLADPLPQLSH
ncbi:alpha/beta hydrolase fold domain-containing protein [Levilactobacillus zymae]|uniref:alpha/beta hydrolase fold domain-containing protein n=1 Tax=Levilactobacillus zymae TaxID=267363 RepID=UPI003FCEE2E2